MNKSDFAAPAPMEGHGAYGRNAQVQGGGLSSALALLEAAAANAPLPPPAQTIVIADYGCADGTNSLAPMNAAIAALRRRSPGQPISIVHTDLPENDFATLFHRLATDPSSYLRDNGIFASAVGRSYFEQILPAASITLGWSSWAIQWLSRLPAAIPDHVQVAYSRDAAARAAFAQQAAVDWRAFLDARGRELRPGALLVIVTMAQDDTGAFGYDAVLAAMYGALEQLVTEGLVQPDELHRMAIPTVARSRADFLAPFAEAGTFADLRVEELAIFREDDRIWNDFCLDHDAQRFGARWAAFSRASVFPTLAAALDGGGKTPRAAAFIDRLEATTAARLATTPSKTNIPLVRLSLARTPDP